MKQSPLKTKVATVPSKPGIYEYKNKSGDILYIGKAKDLRKRVQSYFRKPKQLSIRTQKMLEHAVDLDWIETRSELEALILEDNLIKEHQPKYNILLRDDKNYQYIRVTTQEDFPRIDTIRRIENDGAKYFGPKTSGLDVRQTLDFIKKVFKIRTCAYNIKIDPDVHVGAIHKSPDGTPRVPVIVTGGDRRPPCLDYHIHRCLGPEIGMVTKGEYGAMVKEVLSFLGGHYKEGLQRIREEMKRYAAEKKFELAGRLRDQMQAIQRMAEKQIITDTDQGDRDIIAYVSEYGKNYFSLFRAREGKLIDREHFASDGGETEGEIMAAFLRDYYSRAADFPKEIIVSVLPEEQGLLEEFIAARRDMACLVPKGGKIHILCPQRGKKDHLVALAEKNAQKFAQEIRIRFLEDKKRTIGAIQELQTILGLQKLPERLECYDIAHLGGSETVGSMVVFKKGRPAPSEYRRFRLKTTQGSMDDIASMSEVLRRRLAHLPEPLPEGYKIRKAKKANFPFIEKTCKTEQVNDEGLEVKDFLIIEKKKKIIGFGRLRALDKQVDDVSSVWISPKERGKKLSHFLIKKLISQSKNPRVYLDVTEDLKNHYLVLGFEVILQAPQVLLDKIERARTRAKGFTDKKILYMAYQKKKKDLSFESVPNLIVVDGGKGQLNAALSQTSNLKPQISVISLAKENEEVYVPGKSAPVGIAKDSMAGFLLQRLRDEAHRFANTYHQLLREKKMVE
ncbi:excinuclease ABC subunit UvrC [Candidatus Peregrinibacteria bacterium]|nr:excinuclease ABC subunit UvrC [Candidatus Peregrinibacteria bacterium]